MLFYFKPVMLKDKTDFNGLQMYDPRTNEDIFRQSHLEEVQGETRSPDGYCYCSQL